MNPSDVRVDGGMAPQERANRPCFLLNLAPSSCPCIQRSVHLLSFIVSARGSKHVCSPFNQMHSSSTFVCGLSQRTALMSKVHGRRPLPDSPFSGKREPIRPISLQALRPPSPGLDLKQVIQPGLFFCWERLLGVIEMPSIVGRGRPRLVDLAPVAICLLVGSCCGSVDDRDD